MNLCLQKKKSLKTTNNLQKADENCFISYSSYSAYIRTRVRAHAVREG